MTKSKNSKLILAFLVCLFAVFLVGRYSATRSAGSANVVHAKWLIAHTPENRRLVDQASSFAKKIEERSGGRIQISLVFPSDKPTDGNNFFVAVDQLAKNEVQISQIGTQLLATRDLAFEVFDLPFLFRNHEHAARVFDGSIGNDLRQHLLATTKDIRSLAFTYSGGYRVFVSNKNVSHVEDLAGLSIRRVKHTNSFNASTPAGDLGRVMDATSESLGMKLVDVDMNPELVSQLEFYRNGLVDISDDHYSHYTRLFKKYGILPEKMHHIWETKHTLFLTSIVVNEKFFQSLGDDLKAIIQEEAYNLALVERVDSIKTDDDARAWLQASGYHMHQLTPSERKRFEKKVQVVYDRYAEQFPLNVVQRIREEAGESLANK